MKISTQSLEEYLLKKPQNWHDVINRLTIAGIEVEDYNAVSGIMTLKITPNRGDCLSIYGILREIAAISDLVMIDETKIIKSPHPPCILQELLNETIATEPNIKTQSVANIAVNNTNLQIANITIDNRNPELCPNYYSVVINNIDNSHSKQLPAHIAHTLAAAGTRSINPIVDIANFVMLETGQPLHTFDHDKLVGNKMVIRTAKSGESLVLLDGSKAILNANTLVIAISNNDNSDFIANTSYAHDNYENDGQVIAIAGVMGGLATGVSETTTTITLESASFVPHAIAGKLREYKLNSAACYRFERGVDYNLPVVAIKRFTELAVSILGAKVVMQAHYSSSTNANIANTSSANVGYVNPCIHSKKLSVNVNKINTFLGIALTKTEIANILQKLGFMLHDATTTDNHFSVTVPSYRFDISIENDIIEEVARVYGYDNIPASMPTVTLDFVSEDIALAFTKRCKTLLVDRGYQEIISYAFLEAKYACLFHDSTQPLIRVKNPIASFDVMRSSLYPNLLKTLCSNINRGYKTVRLFELANIFYGTEAHASKQPLRLAGLLYGDYAVNNWTSTKRRIDFYDIKQDINLLLAGLANIEFTACNNNLVYQAGTCAAITTNGQLLGYVGRINQDLARSFDLLDLLTTNNASANVIAQLPFMFELDMQNVIDGYRATNHQVVIAPVSKFQKVVRDLSFTLDSAVQVGRIINAIKATNIEHLSEVSIFDVYINQKTPDYKSIAFSLHFQAMNKTLTEEDINVAIDRVIALVERTFTAQLRS